MQYFTVQSIAKLAAQHALGILHIETLGEPAIASFEPRPSTTSAVATRAVKRITARVATSFLRARRTALFCGSPERNGDYALFAILRKALR